MVVLLFQTGVQIISNWGLKFRVQVFGRLHIKALNLGFKFKLQFEASVGVFNEIWQ